MAHYSNTISGIPRLLSIIVLCIFLLAPPSAAAHASSTPTESRAACVSAVFSFGGSSSDVGNWALSGSTHLPYGGHGHVFPPSTDRSGGRFSNGLLLVDFITKELGLPALHPSLDKSADFSHGASFAEAGATILPTEVLASELPQTQDAFASAASLGAQVGHFKKLVASRCAGAPNSAACVDGRYVGNAVFVVDIGMGASDMYYAMSVAGKSLPETRKEILPRMLEHLEAALEGLIQAGAKKLLILGPGRIGCWPLFASQQGGDSASSLPLMGCNHEVQALAEELDVKVREGLIQKMQAQHPDVFMLYFVQRIAEAMVINGQIPELTAAGRQFHGHAHEACYQPAHSTLCQDPSQYVFWDAVHATEAFQQALAHFFLRGGYHGILLNHPAAFLGRVGSIVSTPTQSLRLSLGCDSTLVQGPLATLQSPYRSAGGM